MDIIASIKNGAKPAKTPLMALGVLSVLILISHFFQPLLMLSCILTPLSLLAFIAIGHFGAKGGASLTEALLASLAASVIVFIVAFFDVMIGFFMSLFSGNLPIVWTYPIMLLMMGMGGIVFCVLLTAFGYVMGSFFKKKA
jgi:hypothetical protein